MFPEEQCEFKEFSDTDIGLALSVCQTAGYEPLYAPELYQRRIRFPHDVNLWKKRWHTMSLRAIGTTTGGAAVAVIAHVPHYFNDPLRLMEHVIYGTKDANTTFPQCKLQRLTGLDGCVVDGIRRVTVLDLDTYRQARSDIISAELALKDPVALATIGSQELLEQYIHAHMQAYDDAPENHGGYEMHIGVWRGQIPEFTHPMATLIALSDSYTGGFSNAGCMLDKGHFLGRRVN